MTVKRKFQFDAAHMLSNYEGKCRNLHGHTYTGEITVEGEKDSSTGMLVDYNDIKKVIEPFDHAVIFSDNEHRGEAEDKLLKLCAEYNMNQVILNEKCTAENIAREIAYLIKQWSKNISKVSVLLHETPDSTAYVTV